MAENQGILCSILVVLAAAGPAAAQQSPTLGVRASDCPLFIAHQATDDVTYRPERDAERGIAPADIASGPDFNDRARTFDFAIWADVRDQGRDNLPTRRAYAADGLVAVIDVRDGVPYLDDRPLSGDDAERVRALCQAAEGDGGEPLQKDR